MGAARQTRRRAIVCGRVTMSRGKGNYRLFTDAEKALMLNLRDAGNSPAKIAELMGEKRQRISDWFRGRTPRRRVARERGRKTAPAATPPLKAGPLPPVRWRESSIPWPNRSQLMARR